MIKQDITSIRNEGHAIERSNSIQISYPDAYIPEVSVLYVRLKKIYNPPLGKLGLEAMMKCDILHYVRVGDAAYKIKIKTWQLTTVLKNPSRMVLRGYMEVLL